MRLKNLLSAILILAAFQVSFAQTVNLQVNITYVERTNYNDCAACGYPDPTWKITAVDNSAGAVLNGPICVHYDEDPNTLEAQPLPFAYGSYNPIWNKTNSSATQFTLGINDAFEKNCNNNNCTFVPYNFFTCFPAVYGDDNECSNPNLVVVNFMDSSPCVVHNAISAWCGNYRFRYSFPVSYTHLTLPTNREV